MRMIQTKFLFIISLHITSSAFAQHNDNPNLNLSKSDRIWLAAYDDTTKALAFLFIEKRNKINKEKNSIYIVAGVSAAVLVTGVLLSARSSTQTPDGENMDFLIPLVGSIGLISSGIGVIGNSLALHPYTLKKYERLLEQYSDIKSLPPFYQKRIAKYLR
jgi:hypothetical protein